MKYEKKDDFLSDLRRIRYGYEPKGNSLLMWIIYTINGIISLIKLKVMMLFEK